MPQPAFQWQIPTAPVWNLEALNKRALCLLEALAHRDVWDLPADRLRVPAQNNQPSAADAAAQEYDVALKMLP